MSFNPDVWGTVADWVVSITAAVGIWFGLKQLNGLKLAQEYAGLEVQNAAKESAAQVQIARAQLLLEIDREFECELMQSSRTAIRALRNTVLGEIKESGEEGKTRGQQQLKLASGFSQKMNTLWLESKGIDTADVNANSSDSKHLKKYLELMRLVNWMETVGFLCRRGLLPTADVVELYDAAIAPTMRNMLQHIQHRREEDPYPNPDFHRNAEWLYEKVREYQRKWEEAKAPPPTTSTIEWN
jgi:hypothetical protein